MSKNSTEFSDTIMDTGRHFPMSREKVDTEVAAGNTKQPPLKKRKRDTHGEKTMKTWVFTIPNWVDQDITDFRSLSGVKKLIWGKEVCPTTGTKHLQCAITWAHGKRFSALKKAHPRWAHMEPAKSIDDAFNYCMKEGDYELIDNKKPSGFRSDLVEVKKKIFEKQSWEEVIQDDDIAPTFARYPKYVESVYQHRPQPKILPEDFKLYKWQQEVINLLSSKPSPREIIWLIDTAGNSGKSTLATYIEENFKRVSIFGNQKTADVAYAIDSPSIVIFDFTRSQQEHLNYEVIEAVKNGRIFSSKYASVHKRFPIPHVICMTNKEPDMTKMTIDRFYCIRDFPM